MSVGKLYIVATPIGNLQDITLRALSILQQVDRIGAEDTRHAAFLLHHHTIRKPIFSVHDWNEQQRIPALLHDLQQGQLIALISDAGTPLISDPGYPLVHAALQAAIDVIPIPGPCAALAALSAAGLPTDSFIFFGFLPSKPTKRIHALMELIDITHTLIFYEAPHRLIESLHALQHVFGASRPIVVARELTKMHESFIRGSIADVLQHYTKNPQQVRGEIVLLVAGNPRSSIAEATISTQHILTTLLTELPLKQAVTLTSHITGAAKNKLYQQALALQNISAKK